MAKPVKGQKDNVNSYVKDLIGAVDEYGKQWYDKKQMAIPELTKYVTPYGGGQCPLGKDTINTPFVGCRSACLEFAWGDKYDLPPKGQEEDPTQETV